MALLVSGVSGRGQYTFTDDSGGFGFGAIRAIVNNFPVIQADFSDRRNPRWYTFGHLSLSYINEMILWESWINYPDQAWGLPQELQTLVFSADQLDLPSALETGEFETNLILSWQMRGDAELTVYYAS